MNKSSSTLPDTMSELWVIKDATATKFQSVADYFVYLGTSVKPQNSKAKTTLKKPRTPRTRQLSVH